MADERDFGKNELEQIKAEPSLKACIAEYQEYCDSYGELVIIDGVSRLRDEVTSTIGKAIKTDYPDPLETSDISGLKRLYQGLLDFEKKYPFIERKLADKASKLPKLGEYITGKRGK
jgi:hypothetical protein